jgi:hypothetical protein
MNLARSWPARCLAVLLVLAPLGATADRSAPRIDVTGVFQSNWDQVRLTQRGDAVTGTYVCCGGGTIEGRIVEGRVLRYRWRQPGAEGRGVWTIEGPDRLDGTWGVGRDEVSGGRWDLERTPEIAQ